MGYAVDIFTSQPPARFDCAVCHDVLESAVTFKECGHSFCEECAKACFFSTGTCPNCRVKVTGPFIPNFIARESIGSMEVKCPYGNDESNKRARGNDSQAVQVSADRCNWLGMCQELKNHETVCDFKMIACNIDGCNHECRRKDMNKHISGGDGFLVHMNLMKETITQSYEKKMEDMKEYYDTKMNDMKQSITKSYEKKIADVNKANKDQNSLLKTEIKSLGRKIAFHESKYKSLQPNRHKTDTDSSDSSDSSGDNDERVRVRRDERPRFRRGAALERLRRSYPRATRNYSDSSDSSSSSSS